MREKCKGVGSPTRRDWYPLPSPAPLLLPATLPWFRVLSRCDKQAGNSVFALYAHLAKRVFPLLCSFAEK